MLVTYTSLPHFCFFAPAVEKALKELCPNEDELDVADFDPVAYINSVFPNEKSLGISRLNAAAGSEEEEKSENEEEEDAVTLADFIGRVRRRIMGLQDDISKTVRTHSSQRGKSKEAVEEAKVAIKEVFAKIKAIKDKAEASEHMVQEICRDIKSLDYAKKHLTETIRALKRLQMLVSAVDQLEIMSEKKQYTDAAKLFQAVDDLLENFKDFDDVPQINRLASSVNRTKKDLRSLIMRDFRMFVPNNVVGVENTLDTLHDGCEVLEVLGDDAKQELITWFCTKEVCLMMLYMYVSVCPGYFIILGACARSLIASLSKLFLNRLLFLRFCPLHTPSDDPLQKAVCPRPGRSQSLTV